VGRVLHLSKDGNLVVKAQGEVAIGTIAYDSRLRPIGVVSDIIGPMRTPYVLVRSKLDEAPRLRGQVIYGEARKGGGE